MTISACIIMKDEQDSVLSMIASIKPYVNEIIVVDTGSTDASIQLVEAEGIKVYPFEWRVNFAEARNYGINLATSDWILWIDCDEQLVVPENYSVEKLLQQQDIDFIRCQVHNFISDDRTKQDHYAVSQYRLFRRKAEYRFTNAIHEHLDIMHTENIQALSSDSEWIIYHDGYRPTIAQQKKKYDRNLSMISNAINNGDPNPWLIYHLASEHYRAGHFSDAFNLLNIAIKTFIETGQYPPSLLYKMKYDIFARTSNYQAIIDGSPLVLQLYPDYVDIYFYLGLAYLASEQYEKAISQFQTCISLGEGHVNYLILKGVGSYRSYYYLSKCYKMLSESQLQFEYEQLYQEHSSDFESLIINI